MNKPVFIIGVFAIIFDENDRILLCHRTDYDLWNLPGGTLEYGEAPWECIIREVKEETGLNVQIDRLSGIYSKPDKNEIVFQYVCTVIGGEIGLNDEADRISYFPINEIPKNTSSKQVERIHDVLINPNNLITKTQLGKSSIEMIKDGLL
jgi:ADP-ribose pyrophosphatase YjhB (NUDIX family)